MESPTSTLDLRGFNLSVGGLYDGGAALAGPVTNSTGSSTLTVGNGNPSTTYNGVLSGSLGLTKVGTGTLTLTNASTTYTGTTTVNAGTLSLSTSSVLAPATPVVLGGGTLSVASGSSNATTGTLTLNASSTIAFGSPASATSLTFANSAATGWTGTLTVSGWNGSTSGGGTSRLFVGANASGLTSTQLANINFTGFGTGAQILATGEVVPLSPTVTASTSSLALGTTTAGAAGTAQNFTVGGSNLTANLIVTAPTDVEVSTSAGSGYGPTVTLPFGSGTVSTTTIFARIKSTAAVGAISGNITAASTGATTQNVSVSGTVNPLSAPEIALEGNATNIVNGDATPSSTDHTDFGSAAVTGGNVVRTFTIRNTGTGALTLTGTPKVAVSGTNAADFTVTTQPTSPVAATNGTTTFQVTFDPSATGVRTATLTITNDDSDEGTFTFAIRGAGLLIYTAYLNGPQEAPANASPGTGTATVTIDPVLRTMRVQASFTGLTGNTTAAHIHGATATAFTGTAGVITTTPSFVGFPTGVTSGSMDQTYDLTLASSYNATFITAQGSVANAETALLNSLAAGTSYFNIHSSTFGGGEIRGFFGAPAPASEIAVSGNATNIVDGDATPSATDHTDFGSTAATSGTVVRTFTITNTGTALLNLTGTPKVAVSGSHASDFTVTTQPTSPVAGIAGTTTFQVTFDPSAVGLRTATLTIANDDSNENPFDFAIQGTGMASAVTPVFLGSGGTSGSGSGGGTINAPDATASASLGRWESIRQGAVLSSNGRIAFRGHMEVGSGTPPVTVDDFQGIWKYDGIDARLKARSGTAAPEAGGALYDMLPLNPGISPDGLITFYGTLRMTTGAPAVTASNNLGIWSEIGGGSARLLLRKGDTVVPGKTFRSGFAVATSTVNTAALNAKLSTGSALLHLDVNTPSVQLTVVAEEGQAAPGGGTWIALDGNSSDPRLSANGDLGFIGWELEGTSYMQGIYSRLNSTAVGTSGAVVQARVGGAAPGTGGATFSAFERPTVFNGGMAFRGFLNANGDNAGGTKGQGVWAGAFGALTPVVRTGDTNAQIPSIPAGATVTSVWSPFSNALGSITMRVGLFDGGGETRAIMGSTGGTMRLIAKVDNAAPGLPGEVFTNFDHPVIGDGDQIAFTASTDAGSYGIWKQAPGGGALSLVMKVGDTISTSEGDKVVSQISLPGATTDDRKFEARCMDATGRLLIHVTFADGSTSLLLGN